MSSALDRLDEMRRRALDRRLAVGPEERERRDLARHEVLARSGLLTGARAIAAYAALPGEPDPCPWLHIAEGRMVALPRVDGRDLSFHFVDGPAGLAEGRWGIPEPIEDRPAPLSELDAVLVPLLVFDSGCARAGRGGGFYDRALARLGDRAAFSSPVLIGVADDEDEVPLVPVRSHDVPLDAVATPSRVHRARSQGVG